MSFAQVDRQHFVMIHIGADNKFNALRTTAIGLSLSASFAAHAANPPGYLGAIKVAAVTPVPEPATYAMILADLGALAFVARRRRAAV